MKYIVEEYYSIEDYEKAIKEKPMNLLNRFKTVIVDPRLFFERVKKETELSKPLKYLLFLLIVIFPLRLLFIIALGNNVTIQDTFENAFIAANSLTLSFFAVFVIAFAFHPLGIIFGFKKPFYQTFKAVVYSSTPHLLYLIIGVSNFLMDFRVLSLRISPLTIWMWFLLVIGFSKLQSIKENDAAQLVFVLYGTLIAIGMIAYILDPESGIAVLNIPH